MSSKINALVEKTNINVNRANKLKKMILGKFQSHPAATSGVLLRLRTQVDKFGKIGEEIESDCLRIATLSRSIEEEKDCKKIYEYSLETPFEIESAHVKMLEKLENLRVKYAGKSSPQEPDGVQVSQPSNTGLKLLDIEVPQFHGETRKFAEFKSIFEILVHNNPALSDYKKLSHLRSALKHDAEKVLSNAAQNNVDYPEAWASICQWFENKGLVLNALFGDLFAIRRVKKQSQLRTLVMEVDLLLHGLKLAGQNIDSWGNWLYFFVST